MDHGVWSLPTIRSDCARTDAGIVDQDVDAAKPVAGGPGDLLGRGIAGQIRLDGEKVGPLSLSRALAARASGG
jgi:hypothetical protein